jgi:hypothetical protein
MGFVKVKALVPVKENGVRRAPGEEWEMEESLVGPHVAAGQVARVAASKQAASPRDKQSLGASDK